MGDEVRCTVIATGFPESPAIRATNAAAFGTPSQRIATPKKDMDVPPASPRLAREETEKKTEQRTEKPATPAASPAPKQERADTTTENEEEDPWGGLPSFLRRK